MENKTLLIIPPSSLEVFSKGKLKGLLPHTPYISLATLAAPLVEAGYDVQILDLSLEANPFKKLKQKLSSYSPEYVGVTSTTPLFNEACRINKIVKEYNSDIVTITGGVHATIFPKDVLKNSTFDISVIGEGDFTLLDIVSGKKLKSIRGICYKKNKKIIRTGQRELIKNLDKLPFPAWHLFDLKRYKTPRLQCRKNPVGPMETSRGCPFSCTFCNRTFGRVFRTKSVKRTVDEMEYVLNIGFKEIHILEDAFTTDMKRAKKICDEIKRRKLKFPWNLLNGIRVDRMKLSLLKNLKEAGVYRVTVGVESGNQTLLNRIKKNIDLDIVRKAFKNAKKARIETIALFMLGLPDETIQTMEETIKFAIELDPDFAKATITIPLPGTELFRELDKKGYIKTKDWSKYYFHKPEEIYTHPNLTWDILYKYYDLFYKRFYFRPKYILKRIKKDLLNGNLLYDLFYLFKVKW